MAALNTNLEVSLWCATKNHLREAWIKVCTTIPCLIDVIFMCAHTVCQIQDITVALKELPLSDDALDASPERLSYHRALLAQINCTHAFRSCFDNDGGWTVILKASRGPLKRTLD